MRRGIKVAVWVLTALLGCGCGVPPESATLTESSRGADREPVTVTMFGFWEDDNEAQSFQAALARKFPHIQLAYEGYPTGAEAYMDELSRRLNHQREADLFLTADTSLWNSGRLLDLTGQELVRRYSVATMQSLSGDGSVSLIPGIGAVQCYACNGNLLPRVPQTLAEMESYLRRSAARGNSAFLVPYEGSENLTIKAFAASYLASPDGRLWLEDYNAGKTHMTGNPHWEAVWELAERLIGAGVLTSADMEYTEADRVAMLARGETGMTTISSTQVEHLGANGKIGSSFALIPFVGELPESRTVFIAPTCYFAASARLDESGSEAKREAVFQILDFISTEEGQTVLRGTSALSTSYLTAVTLPLDERYAVLAETLEQGAFGPAPTFARGVEQVMGQAFGGMLRGELTAREVMAACDSQNAGYVARRDTSATIAAKVVGTASTEFPWTFRSSRTQELAITNLVADSMCTATGADMALTPGTAVRGEFFQGNITEKDIESVLRTDRSLYRAEVTGQQLWDVIEQGVLEDCSPWFITVSGLHYSYRPATDGAPGALLTLTDAGGVPIDPAITYTVAVSENLMTQTGDAKTFYGVSAQKLELTLRGAVRTQIRIVRAIEPVLDGRIAIMEP